MDKENSFKILVVEDDEISRSIYQLFLKNFDLTFCDSDKTMYERLAEDNFQLIIMDIGLPNSKDGLTLINELKSCEKYFKTPVICSTSYDTAEQKINALKAGADVYLAKPVSKEMLTNVIIKLQV